MKHFYTLFIFFLIHSFTSHGQINPFKNVGEVQILKFDPLEKGDTIVGYYSFLMMDRVNSKTHKYGIIFFNPDLNEVHRETFQDSRNLKLLSGNFNGSSLLLKFFDQIKKEVSFKMYDEIGKLNYEKKIQVTKAELGTLAKEVQNPGENFQRGVHLCGDRGFVDIAFVKQKKKPYSYEIRYFSSTNKQDNWIIKGNTAKGIDLCQHIYSNAESIVVQIGHRNKLLSQKVEMRYDMIDISNHKSVKEIKIDNAEKTLIYSGYSVDSNINLLGIYVNEDENIFKDEPQGIVKINLSKDGTVEGQKRAAWSKFNKVNRGKKGKKDKTFVYFEKFFPGKDGTTICIGENIRKRVSGGKVAAQILMGGGNTSVAELALSDLIVVTLDQDMNVIERKKIPKTEHNIELPSGMLYYNPFILAHYAFYQREFDYLWSQTEEGANGNWLVTFMNRDKMLQPFKPSNIIQVYGQMDGEVVQDKITLDPNTKNKRTIYKAKANHILVMEYNKRKKRAEFFFKRLNI